MVQTKCTSPDAHFGMCDIQRKDGSYKCGVGKAKYKVTVGDKDDPQTTFDYNMCASCTRCEELDYELGERSSIHVEELII